MMNKINSETESVQMTLKEYKREGAHRPAQLYTWKEKEKIFPRGVI